MIETKAILAFDLMPLMRYLYRGGVLAVDALTNKIQLTVAMYRATFPDDKIPTHTGDNDYPFRWTTTIDGVEFFALAEES